MTKTKLKKYIVCGDLNGVMYYAKIEAGIRGPKTNYEWNGLVNNATTFRSEAMANIEAARLRVDSGWRTKVEPLPAKGHKVKPFSEPL